MSGKTADHTHHRNVVNTIFSHKVRRTVFCGILLAIPVVAVAQKVISAIKECF